MCEFQNGTLECRGDGYLWDADHEGYDPNDFSWPCPNCNTEQYLISAKEDAESTSSYSDMCSSGSGVTIWENSLTFAKSWNPEKVEEALKNIGVVNALFDDESAPDGFRIQQFNYC